MKYFVRSSLRARITGASTLLLGLSLAGVPSGATAQMQPQPVANPSASFTSMSSVEIAPDQYAVVVDLDENLLHFRYGESTLWSAPIGTGTGLTLRGEGEGAEWEFSTPRGSFQVQYKAENPDWIVPDWHFIENDLPIPPPNDPKRRIPGGLGEAAVYLGHRIAIHGTDKPELLGQQVSHGCIRLLNEYAVRLFHNVQVGTEIIVVGTPEPIDMETAEALVEKAEQLAAERASEPDAPDPLSELPTDVLLTKLEEEIRIAEFDAGISQWPGLADRLITRGLEGDGPALQGLFRLLDEARDSGIDAEYATFLADAYSRGTLQVLPLMAELEQRERTEIAEAIVGATMGMYPGSAENTIAPWPTRRVPRRLVEADAQQGWDALREAEKAYQGEQKEERA